METLSKLSWIEGFVNDLLDPAGRARRKQAVQGVGHGEPAGTLRMLAPVAKPRWGRVLAAVTEVLNGACEPMRARAIHAATEELVGESVSWSSVRNCLAANIGGKTARFERVGHERYRMSHDREGEAQADH